MKKCFTKETAEETFQAIKQAIEKIVEENGIEFVVKAFFTRGDK